MKKTKWMVFIAVLALVVAACSPSDSDSTTTAGGGDATTTPGSDDPGMAGAGGELTLLQWQAPSQANTLLSSGTKDLLAGSLVLEPLAEFAPDGSVVPVLATEVPTVANGGVAADFTSITWTIQEGIVWSDGSPFTTDDILFTFEYCSDELTGCQADFTKIASIDVVDSLTITINFTEPKPYPYDEFVGYTEPVIQRAQFADCVGEQATACTEQNFAPIGTGPYMVTELRPEDTVTYEYNPNYRKVGEGKPFFGTVVIKGGGDAEAAARSVLEIGEADYGWNLQVAPEILLPMEEAGNGVIVSGFAASVEHINLNQTDPDADPPSEWSEDGSGRHPILFQNGQFARALSLAIDRDALVEVGYGPTGNPTCIIWPVGSQASTNQDWCLTRNVDEANSILDELGYVDNDGDGIREAEGFGPLSFTFVTSTNAVRQSNQDIIKSNWADIGVDVEMSNQDASLFFDGTSASDFSIWKFFSDMEMFTNGSSTPDPAAYLFAWTTGEIPTAALGWPSSGNMPRFSLAEYDSTWATLSQTTVDAADYRDLVVSLQDLLVEFGAIIPLIHRADVSAISSDITGFGDALNGWDSEYWNIEDWVRE